MRRYENKRFHPSSLVFTSDINISKITKDKFSSEFYEDKAERICFCSAIAYARSLMLVLMLMLTLIRMLQWICFVLRFTLCLCLCRYWKPGLGVVYRSPDWVSIPNDTWLTILSVFTWEIEWRIERSRRMKISFRIETRFRFMYRQSYFPGDFIALRGRDARNNS